MEIEEFETARPRLLAIATRMLGSAADAEDAVQEAWLRAAPATGIDTPTAWLTTVTSRICLDQLRARRDTAPLPTEPAAEPPDDAATPDQQAELAEAVGAALGAVLDNLGPAERVAFVLHDVFAVPFEDVAAVLGRSPAATRQLASRARRRVTGGIPAAARIDAVRAFLSASRDGDFTGLVDLLDPDAVFRTYADETGPEILAGAPAIAEAFMFRARSALAVYLDGKLGVAVPHPGGPGYLLVMDLAFAPDGRLAAIDAVLRPDEVGAVHVVRTD